VTIRDRDTMLQDRISISELEHRIAEKASWRKILMDLEKQ